MKVPQVLIILLTFLGPLYEVRERLDRIDSNL